MWPSLGFRCSISSLHADNLSFLIILNLTFLMQLVLSATLSRLSTSQLGLERFRTLV